MERSSAGGDVVPVPGVVLERGALQRAVNGQAQQNANIGEMIWRMREILADLAPLFITCNRAT